MQFKNKQLSGVMASAVIFGMAGAAHAATFSNTVAGATAPVKLANELIFAPDPAALDNATAVINLNREGGTFPSGNLVLRVQLNNATYSSAVAAGAVTFDAGCTTATSVISAGGLSGSSLVTFVLSNLNSCAGANDGPIITLPFDVTAVGNVTATLDLTTESGDVPVDNVDDEVLALVTSTDAFQASVTDADPLEVIADVAAAAGPYLDFEMNDNIGSVDVDIDTSVYVSLTPLAFAQTSDIDEVTVTIDGDFSAMADVEFDGTSADTVSPTAATLVYDGSPSVSQILGSDDVDLIPDGVTQIPAALYDGTVAVGFVSASLNGFVVNGDLTPVTRNGSSEVLPWSASGTQGGLTGSNNFVRVSNPTTLDFGPIFATVLSANATGAATVGDTVTLANGLDAGEEVVFTAQAIEDLLGNYGRADLRITVEGEGAYITRLIQRADGTTYEINNRDE